MMDSQALFNVAVTLAGGLGGWILNNIWQSIRTLDRDVRDMPHVYVTKEDYRADISEVKGMLVRIMDKLEGKVDK
jgi:hypothetical protein